MIHRDQVARFDSAIQTLIGDALRIAPKNRHSAAFFLRTLYYQKRAAKCRANHAAHDLQVPALLIMSITQRCNLRCKGCYAQAQHREAVPELSSAELRHILAQAAELGMSIVLLAGGEPLMRADLLDITADFDELLFPLFTNGMLLDDDHLNRLTEQRHVIPVISLEGHQVDTDARRGRGVHAHSLQMMTRLQERELFFGTSLTLTSQNYATVSDPAYLADLISTGCRLFFFVEYVPTVPGTEFLVLTDTQRADLLDSLDDLRQQLPGLFVALPGDEEAYGGCLAAGRGFLHISAQGMLEPCPFAPFSDVNVREMPLADALRSPFLETLRQSDAHLSETRGGCALWAQREWVTSLLQRDKLPVA